VVSYDAVSFSASERVDLFMGCLESASRATVLASWRHRKAEAFLPGCVHGRSF